MFCNQCGGRNEGMNQFCMSQDMLKSAPMDNGVHSRSASQQPYGQPAPAYMPNSSPLPQYAQPTGSPMPQYNQPMYGQPQYAQPPNAYGQPYIPPQNAYAPPPQNPYAPPLQNNYAPQPQNNYAPPPQNNYQSNQQGQNFFPQQAPTQGAVNIQLNMAAPAKETKIIQRPMASGNECSHVCIGMVLAMFCPGIFTFILFCTPIDQYDPYSKYYKMLGSAIFYFIESLIFTVVYATMSCEYYTYSYYSGYYYYYDTSCLSTEVAVEGLSYFYWVLFVISCVAGRIYYWQGYAVYNRVIAA
ncbi:hypothetical protein HDV06_002477 [Boothiomyces sp. JEL0866]|nr:hypothetical protein HDV06_002477 [Boothiomyces sp. JEL0866]